MDIKELAPELAHRTCNRYKHGDEWPYQFTEQGVIDFATRLIAAYTEGQEPVAWMDRDGDVYKMPEVENWLPPHAMLYAAPVKDSLTTEPAPSEFSAEQRDKDWSAFKGAAPSSEEVQSSLKWLRKAEFGAMQEYASRIADMIECLAAHTDYLETVISEHGADMWAQGEEYAVLSAKCAQAQIKADAFEQQNAELVAALEKIAEVCNGYGDEAGWACKHARAALSKVKQP